MFSALCLLHGVLLAQAPLPAAPPVAPGRVASLATPSVLDDPPVLEQNTVVVTTLPRPPESSGAEKAAAQPFSIFSRPFFADRNGLSFVNGTGPGRFNIIDFESRPNLGR